MALSPFFGVLQVKKEASRQNDSLIFEGMTSFRAVIGSTVPGHRSVTRLYFDSAKTEKKARELAFIKRMAAEHSFEVILTDSDEIDALATGTSHGGVIFECTDRTIPSVNELTLKNSLPETDGIPGFYVMIEGIEDPYNFGYAIRSLYAAGVAGIILSPRNWMSAAGVVCRSSAGASELLPLYVGECDEVCRHMKEEGCRIICAGIRDSVPVYDCPMTPPILLIVGGEKRGISAAVLAQADSVVRLDYGRPFGGSLSAASAASIMAYEVFRQNRSDTERSIK